MKVHIFNDGQRGYMTKITNAETGEMLDLHVTEVSIKVHDAIPHAFLTSIFPVVDVVADAEIKNVCLACGRPTEETDAVISYKAMESALQVLTANILSLKTELLVIKTKMMKNREE